MGKLVILFVTLGIVVVVVLAMLLLLPMVKMNGRR
jgi:hypothetical protein